MNEILCGGLLVVLLILLVPVSVLLLQATAAAATGLPSNAALGARPRLAVLVPAHNESAGIRATLDTLIPQMTAGDRVLVVADNCTDDTADRALDGGAEVVERFDPRLRGKGYALAFGLDHLEVDPPEIVVIVDADCAVGSGSIDRIARLCKSSGRPVQALYLMKAPRPAGAAMAVAEFAWLVKNKVRPLGFLRLGLPCQLMGSGMAIEWHAIRSIDLASGHIVEDMQMGVDLARAGKPPLFCPEALVTSEFPRHAEGVRSQRTRWEHGHLSMIVGTVPRRLLDGVLGKGRGLIPLSLDICVPPLALLALILSAMAVATGAQALITSAPGPFLLAILMLGMFAIAVLLSWWRFGTDALTFRELLAAFAYAPRKLPLYFRFLVRRQVEWVRSRRDGE